MKRLLSCFLVLTVCVRPMAGRGQCPSNRSQLEITVSDGLINSNGLTDEFNNTNSTTGKTRNNTGAPFITMRYFLFNRLALGFCGGIANETGQSHDYYNSSRSATYQIKSTTFAMELYYIYSFRKRLELYTFAGFGPSYSSTETTTYISPNTTGTAATSKKDNVKAQYTPIGVRYGGRLGGFAELGVGYKGLINAGLTYKFGSPCWWKQ